MIKNYKIFCDKCGKIITEITIYPDGENSENHRPTLKLSGSGWICSHTSYGFPKDTLLRIAKFTGEKRFEEVAQIDYDAFGFFCRSCKKNYYADCWTSITPVFEDDGFYDYTWANCPVGHKQEIND